MDVYVDTNSCNHFVDRQHHIVVSDKQKVPHDHFDSTQMETHE